MSIPSKSPAVNDVIGPTSSTDTGVPVFDGVTGRKLKGTIITIDGSNNITIPGYAVIGNTRRLFVDSQDGRLKVLDAGSKAWEIEYNPLFICEEMDDFIFASTETGEAGNRGWSFTNGSLTSLAGTSNHPGILLRTSGTTIAQVASFFPGSAGNITRLLMETFEMVRWIIRAPATNTDHTVRIGICVDATANPPANGVYLERLAADTNWWRVVRNTGVQTREDTGIAYNTAWLNIMIKRASNGTDMEFWINNVLNATMTGANIPAGATGMLPFLQIIPTTTTARTIEIDLFHLRSMPVTR